jgi:hypothetical protein
MIKSAQQKELREENFDLITALTNSQIETLIKRGTIQLTFFDKQSNEIILSNGNMLHEVPKPRQEIAKRFAAADINPPRLLPDGFAVAESQKKLTSQRKS